MSIIKPKLLVIDDDARLRQLLQRFLQKQGYDVVTAATAALGETVLAQQHIDMIILDVMMPDETGLAFCQRLRAQTHLPYATIPILMLTARGEVHYRIEGLECGADDYLGKPFESRELTLRIDSILRRRSNISPVSNTIIKLGERSYHREQQILYHHDQTVHLTSVEQDLLQILCQNLKEPLSRDDLALRCGVTLSPRTIDVQITRLRKKIEVDPKQPLYLRTIRHKGYALWPDQ